MISRLRSRHVPHRKLLLAGVLFALVVASVPAEEPQLEQGTLQDAERLFAEKSYDSAEKIYRRLLPSLTGDDRGRALTHLAESLEKLRRLRNEQIFINDPPPFPWSARLDRICGRMIALRWGGWSKLERLERAIEALEGAGTEYTAEANAARFDLINAIGSRWNYQIDFSEWEKKYWRENPDEIELSRQEWQRIQGNKIDRERRKRIFALYEAISAAAPNDADTQTRVLLERGMRRLAMAGAHVSDPFSTPKVKEIVERVRERDPNEDTTPTEEWIAAAERAIASWDDLLARFPQHRRADDAAFLRAHATEHALADLPLALERYRFALETYPESQWSGNIRSRQEAIVREEIRLPAPPHFPSGTKPTITATVRNAPTLRCRLVPISDYLDRVEGQSRLVVPPMKSLPRTRNHRTWEVLTECGDQHKSKAVEVEIPTDQPGAYQLIVDGATAGREVTVLITDLSISVHSAEDRNVAWVTDAVTGEPKEGAEVLFRLERRDYSTTHRAFTDARGVAEWPTPDNWRASTGVRYGKRITAAAVDGAHIATLRAAGTPYEDARTPRFVYYLETDRPAYRPGDTVQYRITLRYWNGDAYQAMPTSGYTSLSFLNPRNEEVHAGKAKTMGSDLSGSFTLDDDAPLGMFTVKVSYGGVDLRAQDWDTRAFRVEEYRLPEFEAIVELPKKPIVVGDPLDVVVRGRFLSGDPMRSGKARIVVNRAPFHFDYEPKRRYAWYTPRNEHHYWNQEEVFSAEVELDADGTAEFTLPNREYEDERDSMFLVTAWVTDSANREESTTARLPVTRTEYLVHLDRKVRLYSPGEKLNVDLRALRPDGTPTAASGRVEISLRRDRQEEREGETVNLTEWELIRTVPVEIAETPTRFDEVIDVEGAIRLRFLGRDARGTEVTAETQVWVASDGFAPRGYLLNGIEMIANTERATLGDTARVLLLSEFENATILVIRSAGARLLGVDTVHAPERAATLEIPLTEAETPNFHLTAVLVHDRKFYRTTQNILVPPVHRFLEGTLTVKQSIVLPGSKETVTLRVWDRDGRAVEGNFTLALFDRAVLSIQPEIARSPLQHFYPEQWGYRIRSSYSSSYQSTVHDRERKPPTQFRVRALPDLLKNRWNHRFQYLAGELQLQQRDLWGNTLYRFGSPEATATAAPLPPRSSAKERARGARGELRKSGEILLDSEVAESADDADGWGADGAQGGSAGGSMAPARVRTNFAATAHWSPELRTNVEGIATVDVTMPDSLTAWTGIARGITADGQVVEARLELRTQKNLLARLATPRFFRVGDEVLLSALVRSQYRDPVSGTVSIAFPPNLIEFRGLAESRLDGSRAVIDLPLSIDAESETTIDLPFRVRAAGEVELTLIARTPRESDALVRRVPSLPYGIDQYIGGAGIAPDIDGPSKDVWEFLVPEESASDSRTLSIDLTPSPAIALIESLPYLVRYPHGCVEQTLHRFLPAAITARLLEDLDVDLEEILPERPASIPSGFWGHLEERPLELFRADDLERLVDASEKRLFSFQNGDGSWGWWSGFAGDPYITALVVDGFATAHEAGLDVNRESFRRGAEWLLRHLASRDLAGEKDIYDRPDYAQFAFIARALFRATRAGVLSTEKMHAQTVELADLLYAERDHLGAQGMALLALGIHALELPDDPRPEVLLRNLTNFEKRKPKWGTTHYGELSGYRWWGDSAVESTAHALRAFLAIAPEDERVPEIVRWLLENRQGSHYDSTRSTAAVAFALTDALRKSGELDADLSARVLLDGREIERIQITRADIFSRRFRVNVPASALAAGTHRLEIERSGRGPLYWSAGLEYYNQADRIPAEGNRLTLERRYYRIIETRQTRTEKALVNGREVERTVPYIERSYDELVDGAVLRPGDRVQVRIDVESANRFRYLIFEDRKPAGLEAVDVRSGYVGGTFGYREFRDSQVNHFASFVAEGKHQLTYELRAERPGVFQALPATAYAMYLPHIRANSENDRVEVASDREPTEAGRRRVEEF